MVGTYAHEDCCAVVSLAYSDGLLVAFLPDTPPLLTISSSQRLSDEAKTVPMKPLTAYFSSAPPKLQQQVWFQLLLATLGSKQELLMDWDYCLHIVAGGGTGYYQVSYGNGGRRDASG